MAMFCPNCGASEQSPDTYCKKCGTHLRDLSFRGLVLGGNNPVKAASAIVISSVFVGIICVCISLLIAKAYRSGDLAYLQYALRLVLANHRVLNPNFSDGLQAVEEDAARPE